MESLIFDLVSDQPGSTCGKNIDEGIRFFLVAGYYILHVNPDVFGVIETWVSLGNLAGLAIADFSSSIVFLPNCLCVMGHWFCIFL